MATKKPASAAKKPTRKPAKSSSVAAKSTTKVTSASTKKQSFWSSMYTKNEQKSIPYVFLAEIIGTFILTAVATASFVAGELGALTIGLAYAALVVALGAVSGAHLNPAVTFGLWVAGKIRATMIPAYWLAQFIGAALALVVLNGVAGTQLAVNFSHFADFDWNIAGVEAVAAAVFVFGVVAVMSRQLLSDGAKALGVGLSLTVALVVGVNISTSLTNQALRDYQANASATEQQAIPREALVGSATVNPAVALAVNEKTESQLYGQQASGDEEKFTRFGLEVIVGTLGGALIGAGLARALGRSE